MKNTNLLAQQFRFISSTINGAERAFLDLLGAIVPYMTPLTVAYLTYFHTQEMMGFPDWIA